MRKAKFRLETDFDTMLEVEGYTYGDQPNNIEWAKPFVTQETANKIITFCKALEHYDNIFTTPPVQTPKGMLYDFSGLTWIEV